MVVMFDAGVAVDQSLRARCLTIVAMIVPMRMVATATGFMAVRMLVVPAVMSMLVIQPDYEWSLGQKLGPIQVVVPVPERTLRRQGHSLEPYAKNKHTQQAARSGSCPRQWKSFPGAADALVKGNGLSDRLSSRIGRCNRDVIRDRELPGCFAESSPRGTDSTGHADTSAQTMPGSGGTRSCGCTPRLSRGWTRGGSLAISNW